MKIRKLINFFLLGIIITTMMLNSCNKDDDPKQEDPVYSQDKGEFTDSRDNKTYKWVKIGTQIWMAENLSYIGNDIQHITVDNDWENNSDYDGWCYYDNNVNYGSIYGVLYQWKSAKTACPNGWHLPTDNEWTQLEEFLKKNGFSYDGIIGNSGIAKSLASNNGWSTSNYQGTVGNTDFADFRNKTGFSALPYGFRNYNGNFDDLGKIGYWWSATVNDSFNAYGRYLDYDDSEVSSYSNNKLNGFSVRCVKD